MIIENITLTKDTKEGKKLLYSSYKQIPNFKTFDLGKIKGNLSRKELYKG